MMRCEVKQLLSGLAFLILALPACSDRGIPEVGESCDNDREEYCDGDLLLQCKGGEWTLDDDCKEKTGGTCRMDGDNGVCTSGSPPDGGVDDPCIIACTDLYGCTQQECPYPVADSLDAYLNGSGGCVASCHASPALTALVDPSDCATTVATIAGVNPSFNEACFGAP